MHLTKWKLDNVEIGAGIEQIDEGALPIMQAYKP